MAGLLDFIGTPEGQGLLSAAFGGLASARRGAPLNAIGAAGLAGLQGYDQQRQYQDNNTQRQLQNLQLQKGQLDLAQQQRLVDLAKKYSMPADTQAPAPAYGMVSPQAFGPEGSSAPIMQVQPQAKPQGFDFASYIKDLAAIDPQAALKLQIEQKQAGPKYSTDFRMATGSDGKPHNFVLADDGSWKDTGLAPIDKIDWKDTGGGLTPTSSLTGGLRPDVPIMAKTQSPDSKASNALGWANYNKPVLNTELGGWVTPPVGMKSGETVKVTGLQKPLTEAQSNANIFATRANQAHKILTELDGQFSPTAIQTKQGLGKIWGVGGALEAGANAMLPANTQKAEQAQRDFVNAVLRKESGAAISPSEFDNAIKQYFPQPGDTPENIEQKRQNRILEIQGLQTAASPAGKFDVYTDKPSTISPGGWSAKVVK